MRRKGDFRGRWSALWDALKDGARELDARRIWHECGQIMEECATGAIKGDKGDTGATGPQGPQGETGPQGPAGADGASGAVPLVIAAGETFTVPANRQVLFTMPIDVQGVLDVEGFLVEVS